MSSLKQLRSRIKSIKSTQKITKAMQMVAASKLKKIKHQINDSERYVDILEDMMISLLESEVLYKLPKEAEAQKFFPNENNNLKHLLIIISSERGLCGSFNTQIIKQVKADISKFEAVGEEVKLIIIGKKGYDAFKTKYQNNIYKYYNTNTEISGMIEELKEQVVELVKSNMVTTCQIYFNKFKNALTQIPTRQQILPVEKKKEEQPTNSLGYEFEGSNVISELINMHLIGQINYSLLQSRASEEAARMTAMDNATKNANDIIDKLTLKLNRSRQAIITKELTEIISGAEAV